MTTVSMADRMRRAQFLGREFLTWLMVRSAQNDQVFRLSDGREVEVFFERALTLEGENPAREMSTIRVDDPTDSEEVRLALSLGKKVGRARVKIVFQGREVEFVLDSALALKSVRLPETPLAVDPLEVLVAKAEAARELEDVIHDLFIAFVRMRLDPVRWAREMDEVTAWVRGGSRGLD